MAYIVMAYVAMVYAVMAYMLWTSTELWQPGDYEYARTHTRAHACTHARTDALGMAVAQCNAPRP